MSLGGGGGGGVLRYPGLDPDRRLNAMLFRNYSLSILLDWICGRYSGRECWLTIGRDVNELSLHGAVDEDPSVLVAPASEFIRKMASCCCSQGHNFGRTGTTAYIDGWAFEFASNSLHANAECTPIGHPLVTTS